MTYQVATPSLTQCASIHQELLDASCTVQWPLWSSILSQDVCINLTKRWLSDNDNFSNRSSGSLSIRKPTPWEVWGIGLAVVTLINACACLGAIFVPCMKQNTYKLLLSFMVALAVGSLSASTLLILLPEALGLKVLSDTYEQFRDYVWKCTAVLAGIYGFFLLERILKVLQKSKFCHRNQANPDSERSVSQDLEITVFNSNELVPDVQVEAILTGKSRLQEIAPVAWMIVVGDSAHNFVDGLAMGAAFSHDTLLGVSISLAVLCEELPHELGDFAILLNSGMSIRQALFANWMSAGACYLGFIIGALLGDLTDISNWIMAVSGGMFLYISLVDMLPEVIQALDSKGVHAHGRWKLFLVQNVGLLTGYCALLTINLLNPSLNL